ncbi:MAG: hypothetical protein JRJ12_17755 [Deltaproteobacteria bacterium]|nr:hypothetical protein [Deltaproteobacteria bacterium]MBW2073097.1 hypothetical protein [Deltaproteobacteria bacterium]
MVRQGEENNQSDRKAGEAAEISEEAALEEEIEHFKELLLEHDRSLFIRLSDGEKPSPEEKRARSQILRHLNRARRRLYRLRKSGAPEMKRRLTIVVTESEYDHIRIQAQEEGMSLSAYIRWKLMTPDS